MAAWHELEPWPDVRRGLELLRRRYVTAAVSNGHTALLVDLARHGDLRFDCLLSAKLARVYKPAPRVYLTAARLLGLDPGEVMMVASHPGDLAAARTVGLRSAFVDRPLEHGLVPLRARIPTRTFRLPTSWSSRPAYNKHPDSVLAPGTARWARPRSVARRQWSPGRAAELALCPSVLQRSPPAG